MNECASTRWKRCLAGMCLSWFALWVGSLHAAEPKYLSITAFFTGTGEHPNLGDHLEGARQQWGLLHTYTGRVEVVIEEIEISPAPNRRTRLVITPIDIRGRTNRVIGSIVDSAMNGFKEFGEGGSSAEHGGQAVWSAVAPVEARDLGLSLELEPEAGVWGVQFSPGVAQAALSKRETYQATGTRKPGHKGFGELWQYVTNELNDRGWIPPSENADQRLVFTGFHPRDSVTLTGRMIQQSLRSSGTNYTGSATTPLLVALPGKGSINLSLTWTLLDALPEVELVVRSPRYSEWLPKLQPDGSPGEKLRLVARVESPKGEDLSRIQCESISWTLVDTSREPGICMNYPLNAMDFESVDHPDLRITEIPTDADGQVGDEPEPENNQSEIEIEPHDWGGWSVMRVEAKLKDGRVLKGRLENPPDAQGEYDIRLPRRKPHSKIAKVWLEQEGVSDQEDADDKDPLPKGKPGIDGDGLSLFQEYRGFQVKGSHRRTNPKVKDLFIQNRAGPRAASAIQKFDNISGLEVHLPRLDEFDPEGMSFIINRNRNDGPTRGLQFGLLVKVKGDSRPNDDIPPDSRPHSGIPIRVPEMGSFMDHGGVSTGKARDHFVLQALFQSVAVQRPGPTDDVWVFIHKTQPPGSPQPPEFVRRQIGDTKEESVIVLDLAGADLAQAWNVRAQRQLDRELKRIPPNLSEKERAAMEDSARFGALEYWWMVGEKGGAHSGPEECLMRDWFAEVHESEFTGSGGAKVYRYIDPKARREKPGDVLGATQDGTGINHATSNRPESRYGPRTAPGPASEQLIVNDNP